MRTQWTAKGNRDAGSSCSCDRGLHRYLRNFGGGGGVEPPPLGTPLLAVPSAVEVKRSHFAVLIKRLSETKLSCLWIVQGHVVHFEAVELRVTLLLVPVYSNEQQQRF